MSLRLMVEAHVGLVIFGLSRLAKTCSGEEKPVRLGRRYVRCAITILELVTRVLFLLRRFIKIIDVVQLVFIVTSKALCPFIDRFCVEDRTSLLNTRK